MNTVTLFTRPLSPCVYVQKSTSWFGAIVLGIDVNQFGEEKPIKVYSFKNEIKTKIVVDNELFSKLNSILDSFNDSDYSRYENLLNRNIAFRFNNFIIVSDDWVIVVKDQNSKIILSLPKIQDETLEKFLSFVLTGN